MIVQMPLEQAVPEGPLTVVERRQAGQDLRKFVPRRLHAAWTPPPNRADPVQTLIETGRHRISSLLPIRYDRMRQSAFAFLRGAAAVMAGDLATTPTSGLTVQACGDCHLANFGVFASPEGTPVFDVNDFDETLPAPFEWDLKRLATSFAVDARGRGLPPKACRQLARSVATAYREHMAELARLDPLVAWRARVDVAGMLDGIEDTRLREREVQRLQEATIASQRGYPKLLERSRGRWRIRARPPLVVPLTAQDDDTHELAARTAFASYAATLPEERAALLARYRLSDLAFKVVGIGSVGTFCAIGLFTTADEDILLLQIKEAQASVLAPYAGRSAYANQGKRVVTGQRMMQAVTDVFLGWTQDAGDDRHCYVRQLKDQRMAMIGTQLADAALPYHAVMCGRTLARAHARSGDAARIAGYMGSGGAFDTAIAGFAMAYATQTDRDFRLFVEAIKSGVIEAQAA
jgi:uncharacterized protein (DUF2252 family)